MPPAFLRAPPVDNTHKRGCTNKHGYASEAEARNLSRRLEARKRLYVYRCQHCGHWHLTSHAK